MKVLKGEVWRIIHSSQDLVWSEAVLVMVRVSLESHDDGAGKLVPRVHFTNWFVNTVFVLLSDDAVVLNVVDGFDPVEADGDVAKLEFQGFPAEEEVDAVKDTGMEYLIPDHFVVAESCE